MKGRRRRRTHVLVERIIKRPLSECGMGICQAAAAVEQLPNSTGNEYIRGIYLVYISMYIYTLAYATRFFGHVII